MIDTISSSTRFIPSEKSFSHIQSNWKCTYDKEKGYIYYWDDDTIKLFYYQAFKTLSSSFSLPKYIYGSSLIPIKENDIILLLERVATEIRFMLRDRRVAEYRKWNLSRIDLFHDHHLDNKNDMETYIDAFKQINYHRCKVNHYDTSIAAGNKTKRNNFYDKTEEILVKTGEVIQEDIIRTEEQLKYEYLRRALGNDRPVEMILNYPQVFKEMFEKEISRLYLDIPMKSLEETKTSINNLVEKKFLSIRRAKNIIEYIEGNRIISRSTYYFYRKVLAENNINIQVLSRQVTSKLSFDNFSLFTPKEEIIPYIKSDLMLLLLILFLMQQNMIANIVLPVLYPFLYPSLFCNYSLFANVLMKLVSFLLIDIYFYITLFFITEYG